MTEHRLVTIVKELYAALPAMDWDTYTRHLHPDFKVVESDGLPFAGEFSGMDGFMALIGKVFEMFSEFVPVAREICVGEDSVMVWVDITLTGKQTGKTVTMPLIEVFKFQDDKLIEIRPFYFNPEAVKAIV